jgi:hypothetical protein
VGTSWGLRRGNPWHEVAATGTKWRVNQSYIIVTRGSAHLAKVRVAGSNPVVRSHRIASIGKGAGEKASWGGRARVILDQNSESTCACITTEERTSANGKR